MKNKEYRIKHRPGQNVELVENDINYQKTLNKRHNNYKPITLIKEREQFNEGYNLGITNASLNEEDQRLDNVFFKRGYLLGIRKYLVLEDQRIRNQIESLVTDNIPLEECPDYIQNSQIYRTTYMIEKVKQRQVKKK